MRPMGWRCSLAVKDWETGTQEREYNGHERFNLDETGQETPSLKEQAQESCPLLMQASQGCKEHSKEP